MVEKVEISDKNQRPERIIPKVIEDEMKKAYIDYAMSVIVSRALPDVRDGLKPVHRRIIYSMHQLGLTYNKPFRKCARIVGDCLGKYHPHGDASVYDALVRMAQDFSLRYPLVNGQGNFGCFTKDTKVRLTDGRDLSFAELIKEHKQGKRNFTFAIDDGLVKIAEVKNPRLTKKNTAIIKVILDNGEEIRCTPNHRFMLRDGSYKEARNLKGNDSLMPVYFRASNKSDNLKPELLNYQLVYQPKENTWEPCHLLADKWNLEHGVYPKSSGKIRHHIDFNKFNNAPCNVKRVRWKEHWDLHKEVASLKHKDKRYRKKIAEGRKKFWAKKENRVAYSERLSKRNLENWKKAEYRERMKKILSEVNKEHIKKYPELKKVYSKRASKTLKRLWKDPCYRKLFHEKIVDSNKRRKTNNTGKIKFLKICSFVLKGYNKLSKELYEKARREIFKTNHTSWDLGISKYFNNDINLLTSAIKKNHKIKKIEILKKQEDVYDLTIDGTHNFALASGVFVHNSVDGDSAAAMRYCITGDSLILTDKGILPIRDMSSKKVSKINTKILSYDGKRNSASKFFNSGKHKVIEIKTSLGYRIKGSYNHPLMCWAIEKGSPKIQWKLLEHLKGGDIVLINRGLTLFSKKDMGLTDFKPKIKRAKDIKLPLRMNSELAFLLGALVSEGSFHQNKIYFSNSDRAFYNYVKEIIYRQFEGVQLYERKISGNCLELNIYHQLVVEFLKNLGLKEDKSDKKEIPFSILRSSKKTIAAFLRGLFEGDGSVTYKVDRRHKGKSIELTYNSKSTQLIEQLKVVLLNFGIVTTKPYRDKRNNCYKLIISGYDTIKRFRDEIDFFSDKKRAALSNIVSINRYRMSKTDLIPYLNDYLRDKYKEGFVLKNNFDRYNNLEKNYGKLIKIIDNQDKGLIDTLLSKKYLFDEILEKVALNKEEAVYSIKVESNCHSFVANGFINHNTEAKLTKISGEMLQDIDKKTVKFVPNFDNSLEEPTVLPSKLPNLLVNGSAGIAVGMATNIPPHNLREVCDAIMKVINDPETTINGLFEIIKGPDFPTAGIIAGRRGILEAYATGRGHIRVKSKAELEEDRIIITEIPYMVNKALLVEQIADLIKDKKVTGISDLRDESDREGMRIVIELKKGSNPEVVLNQLLKHSRLQTTFGINIVALVNNEPKTLNLKELITHYISYRRDVITKRTMFDLERAAERAHILQGLIIALTHIDKVIEKIKKSRDVEEAQLVLKKDYSITEKQAKAILEMRLQKLASLEQQKIRQEHNDLLKLVEELKSILASEQKILSIIRGELEELKNSYGDERKTVIIEEEEEDLEIEDLIEEEDVVVTISHKGYTKRQPVDVYKQQKRGGKGIIAAGTGEEDFIEDIFIANTHSYILFFTNMGQVYWLKVYRIPDTGRQAKGSAIVNLLELKQDEKITAFIPIKEFDDKHYLIMATKNGTVKKTSLKAYSRPRAGGIRGITLENDELVNVIVTDGAKNVILATKKGMAVKFSEKNVRNMGRTAKGVRGIKLRKGDEVIGMVSGADDGTLLTVTENGYGKRTLISEYRLINRGGTGVKNIICSERNGKVVEIKSVRDGDELMLISKNGIAIRCPASGISVIGRNTQGVRLMKLDSGDKVVAAAKIASD